MNSVCIIGGGISGLSVAQCLKDRFDVKVLEKDSRPGGLIKCDTVNGNLYHKVGGHVFNSHKKDVLDWFWRFFDKETEFTSNIRNAIAYIDKPIDYPVENHIYQLENELQKEIIKELLSIAKQGYGDASNFEDFLKYRFGEILYNLYFKPYNEKIWNTDLSKVPLSWLEGKMPMPSIEDIFYNNFHREKEVKMVHSSFYYPKLNGSQFLADRLAKSINIEYNFEVTNLVFSNNKWIVNDTLSFDFVIFAGNIKELPSILLDQNMAGFNKAIEELESHGTTTVLCKMTPTPYSWIYLPDKNYATHRIICTGNFSDKNNAKNTQTATVEFTDYISKEDILDNLTRAPFSLEYIMHHYTKYTYPIQNNNTRKLISSLKDYLRPKGFFLIGRFAEWEYYNMDTAVAAAMDLSNFNFESVCHTV
jgi:protoporphyrinogen oxidase